MPAEIEPVALAQLVEFAERPRTHDWSLRAALVRYAQAQPQRVNDILDLVRRTDAALGQHAADLVRNGEELWNALNGNATPDVDAQLLGLLRVAQELDRLGDILATWAVDRADPRPDEAVDEVLEAVAPQLDALGVPHQERPPGPRSRG